MREFAGTREPTPCMCVRHSVSREEGDHNECPIELLACPEHTTRTLLVNAALAGEFGDLDRQPVVLRPRL